MLPYCCKHNTILGNINLRKQLVLCVLKRENRLYWKMYFEILAQYV